MSAQEATDRRAFGTLAGLLGIPGGVVVGIWCAQALAAADAHMLAYLLAAFMAVGSLECRTPLDELVDSTRSFLAGTLTIATTVLLLL